MSDNKTKKTTFRQAFARRLKEALIGAGFSNTRSMSGVDIQALSTLTGYSTQICRHFIHGEVIPSPEALVKLAADLRVLPGWLMFGEVEPAGVGHETNITINQDVLCHLFVKAIPYCKNHPFASEDELAEFFTRVASITSLTHASEEARMHLVDLMLRSIKKDELRLIR